MFEVHSPWDGATITNGNGVSEFGSLLGGEIPAQELPSVFGRLAEALRVRKEAFVETTRLETGFTERDAREIVEGALAYVEGFANHPTSHWPGETSYVGLGGDRRVSLRSVPYGTVAVILPQNAFLTIGLTCMLNGLRSGNRVILRAPSQSAASTGLLADVLEDVPEIARSVALVVCAAKPFVDWFFEASMPGVLHFLGSSRRAPELMERGFTSGKSVLIDGEGNVWAYVHPDCPVDRAVELILAGAFRYNGQTCTSLNGAIIHQDLFEKVCEQVTAAASKTKIGPVFNEEHAEWCLAQAQASGGDLVCGGIRSGAWLEPTVVVEPDRESALVREGVFGPVLWLGRGDDREFERLWSSNRYPLCATVLQKEEPERWLDRLPGLGRLVVNGDPSVEDPFEFWGGYPASAQHAVSSWISKYRRTIQVDAPDT